MAEYSRAFRDEIAIEGFVQDIGAKAMKIFHFIGQLIHQTIDFLMKYIKKLNMVKSKNTPVNPNSTMIVDSPDESPEVITRVNTYDCGKELNDIVSDLQFCIELLAKRPAPNHKIGKGYSQRWDGDNELIADRMTRCADVLDRLNSIESKSMNSEMAENLKRRLETLNAQYDKYGKIYQAFVKKNAHTEQFLISTMISFNLISEIATKTLNLTMQL